MSSPSLNIILMLIGGICIKDVSNAYLGNLEVFNTFIMRLCEKFISILYSIKT